MDRGFSFTFQGKAGNGLIVAVIKSAGLPDPQKYLIKSSGCEYYKSHSAA